MQSRFWLPVIAIVAFAASVLHETAPAAPAATAAPAASAPASTAITSGWTLLKEGEGDGTIEVDAKNPSNSNPHLLKLAMTKYPDPGKGRFGTKNTSPITIKDGQWYDITFRGTSEGIGVGLVFSLETDDGKVLARTTLPEIGRGARGGGGRGRGGPATSTAPATPWRDYMVSLHARGASQTAHLVITPIETVPVWIDGLTLLERKPVQ